MATCDRCKVNKPEDCRGTFKISDEHGRIKTVDCDGEVNKEYSPGSED